MKSIYVTTPDNIEVEYRLAGAGSRAGAAIIDTVVQLVIFFVVLLAAFFSIYNYKLSRFFVVLKDIGNVAALVLLAYFIIFFGYFLLCEIIMKGQTVGKKIFHLRTIRRNGQPITFIQSIIRNIIRVVIDNLGVGIVTMLFSKENKRIGDMLAGTVVISENPRKFSTKSLIFNVPENIRDTSVNESLYSLTHEEYEILKDYFARKYSFIDNGHYAKIRIYEYFAKKYEIDAGQINDDFLYTIASENAVKYTT